MISNILPFSQGSQPEVISPRVGQGIEPGPTVGTQQLTWPEPLRGQGMRFEGQGGGLRLALWLRGLKVQLGNLSGAEILRFQK